MLEKYREYHERVKAVLDPGGSTADGGSVTDLKAKRQLDPAELMRLKAIMTEAVGKQVEEGLREGFSVSITGMFAVSLITVFLAFGVCLFIPEVPLRHGAPHELRNAELSH